MFPFYQITSVSRRIKQHTCIMFSLLPACYEMDGEAIIEKNLVILLFAHNYESW